MLVKLISEDKRTVFKSIFDEKSKILDLVEVCKQKFQKEPYEYDFVFGYPPKVLKYNVDETLKNSGITNGEAITLRINLQKKIMFFKLKAFGYTTDICLQSVNIETDDVDLAIEICHQIQFKGNGSDSHLSVVMRKVIDADNSCLFNAIAYLQSSTASDARSTSHYRRIVAESIRNDPSVYLSDMVDESRSPEEYAQWILEPSKWGGEIEMSILSSQLHVEIAAVDIETTMIYIYGEGRGYDQRLYLLYDGIHYDALVMAPSSAGDGGASPVVHASNATSCSKVFASSDESVERDMKQYAVALKESKKFISLSGCDLKCNICSVGLKGQSGALEHAKLTGHTNFGQI